MVNKRRSRGRALTNLHECVLTDSSRIIRRSRGLWNRLGSRSVLSGDRFSIFVSYFSISSIRIMGLVDIHVIIVMGFGSWRGITGGIRKLRGVGIVVIGI